MVLRSIDHRMQLFPMDTNQQCYVCNVSPKSSYLDIFHRIDNNRPDSAQSASGKHIYNKKNWPLSLLLYGYFGELYTTKYPGKPSEGKKMSVQINVCYKLPWPALPLPHRSADRALFVKFFHHLWIEHQVDDRIPTDGGFGKEQARNLW